MQKIINKELEEKIIAVAYGDSSVIDRVKIWFLSLKNQQVKILLNEYKTTAKAVQEIDEKTLPEKVLQSIKSKINFKREVGLSFSFFNPKFAVAGSLLMIVCAAVISYFTFFNQDNNTTKYSKSEIELAQKQARESLEIVAKVFRRTEVDLDHDILTKKISKPLNEGLTIVSDYVTGG
jgi:hypothetical protein